MEYVGTDAFPLRLLLRAKCCCMPTSARAPLKRIMRWYFAGNFSISLGWVRCGRRAQEKRQWRNFWVVCKARIGLGYRWDLLGVTTPSIPLHGKTSQAGGQFLAAGRA